MIKVDYSEIQKKIFVLDEIEQHETFIIEFQNNSKNFNNVSRTNYLKKYNLNLFSLTNAKNMNLKDLYGNRFYEILNVNSYNYLYSIITKLDYISPKSNYIKFISFFDADAEKNIRDGKPEINWTYEEIYEELKDVVDNKKELKEITRFLMNYIENIENRNVEFLNAMDIEFNLVCNQYTIGESGGVDLCLEGIKASNNNKLLCIIHNHPSNNPIPSSNDIKCFSEYNVKYSFIFTEINGFFVLKNNCATSNDIEKGWNDSYKLMFKSFRDNRKTEYTHILDLYQYGGMNLKMYKTLMMTTFQRYISNNIQIGINSIEKGMIKNKVHVKYLKSKN